MSSVLMLRFGEMEKDCMLGHGAAIFFNERTMKCSDLYSMKVCKDCGGMAVRKKTKDVYICPNCTDKSSGTNKVRVPYAFKTLIQELFVNRILVSLKT